MDNDMAEEKKEQKNELIIKNMSDQVFKLLNQYQSTGQISFPKDYNVENAIKSAYLTLLNTKDKASQNALDVCDQHSVVTALTDMAIQGLSPAKKQCYFIVRGKELTMMRSYFGSQTALKRLPGIKDVHATCIYKGDAIETGIKDGEEILIKHETKFENRDNEIIGAYAVIEFEDGKKRYTFMTKKEIDACWNKSSSKEHTVHKEFPQEMTKRTVINRACKSYVNTSLDSDVLIDAFNRTTENEYDNTATIVKEEKTIDIDVVEESKAEEKEDILPGQQSIEDINFDA